MQNWKCIISIFFCNFLTKPAFSYYWSIKKKYMYFRDTSTNNFVFQNCSDKTKKLLSSWWIFWHHKKSLLKFHACKFYLFERMFGLSKKIYFQARLKNKKNIYFVKYVWYFINWFDISILCHARNRYTEDIFSSLQEIYMKNSAFCLF